MGKCCSKTQPERPLMNPGYKKNDPSFAGLQPNGGSLDSRYTPDPNRGPVKTNSKTGADIIRARTTPSHPMGNASRRRIVVGVYSYQAREDSDVSFSKGDRMEVIDDTESDWWRVVHLTTRREGLIPWNFVAEERSVESEDWFFDHISRKEADKLLLADENPRGTFLVRPSEHNPSGYSLSVKDWEEVRGYHVKHYKIKPLDNGGFYIATNQTFPSLPALVLAYTNEASDYIGQVLGRPCRKRQPQVWDLGPGMRDQWEIPHEEITLTRAIASGNFGEVHLGYWRDKLEVAVKTLKRETMSLEDFLAEAQIMKAFRHHRLLALYGICSKNEPIYIVTEYMKNGSLLKCIRSDDAREKFNYDKLISFAGQIVEGMYYLEEKKFVHRDLAARNVLMDNNYEIKICDFGLARAIKDDVYYSMNGSKFPLKWSAPESILRRKFTSKSDVWSFGVLLMELFTYGEDPYPGMKGSEIVDNLERGYRMPKPVRYTLEDEVYALMVKCWSWDPDVRPDFAEISVVFDMMVAKDYVTNANNTEKEQESGYILFK